jgi:hypothetical protein
LAQAAMLVAMTSDAPATPRSRSAEALPTLLSDINMLVLTGGRERTNSEYEQLLATAGLALGEARPVAFPYGVIEGLTRVLGSARPEIRRRS